jgi:chromosome partitioning protein
LLDLGFKVASIDVDCRQGSLSRYLENRNATIINQSLQILSPVHHRLSYSKGSVVSDIEEEERVGFETLLQKLQPNFDFIVIDTPGSNTYLSRLAHSYANTIVTPINDSFVDLDVLALVEADHFKIKSPSIYSQMVWEQKMHRAKRDGGSINWVVMRNRLTAIDAKNKRNMAEVVERLSQRIGFRVVPGFGERVIFRELFLQGLTLLDLKNEKLSTTMNMSHIAARQELREFLKALNINQLAHKVI